ncbi:MAG: hypothetical protein FJ225_04725 [Lentisphaerae bacterium]|nr:hypothetical protein [Lentisphaerota bacterium]
MALGEKLRDARLRRKLTASQVAIATRMKMQTVEALEAEDFAKLAAPIYGKGFIRMYAEYVGLDPAPLVEEYLEKMGISVKRRAPEAEPETGTPASPAPAEAADEEPDLFSRAASRPPAPPAPPAPAPAAEPAASPSAPRAARLPKIKVDAGAVRAAAAGAWGRARAACAAGAAATVAAARRFARAAAAWRMPRFAFRLRLPATPWKTVSVTVAALIVLAFIISALMRCAGGPAGAGGGARQPGALRVAVEPPDPYIDAAP